MSNSIITDQVDAKTITDNATNDSFQEVIESSTKYLKEHPNNVRGFYRNLDAVLGKTTNVDEKLVLSLLKLIFDNVNPVYYSKYGCAHRVYFSSYLSLLNKNMMDAQKRAILDAQLAKLTEKYEYIYNHALYRKDASKVTSLYHDTQAIMKDMALHSINCRRDLEQEYKNFIKQTRRVGLCSSGKKGVLGEEEFSEALSLVESFINRIERREYAYRSKEKIKVNTAFSIYKNEVSMMKGSNPPYHIGDLNKTKKDFFNKVRSVKDKSGVLFQKLILTCSLGCVAVGLLTFVLTGFVAKVNYELVNKSSINQTNAVRKAANTYNMTAVVDGFKGLIFDEYYSEPETVEIDSQFEGKDVTAVANYSFKNKTKIKNVYLPETISTIGQEAFYNCSSLESIVLPKSTKTLGEKAFYNCTSLKNISLNDGLASISDGAFTNCSSLESIYIPSSVLKIGSKTFEGCNSLENIYYQGSSDELKKICTDYNSYVSKVECSSFVITLHSIVGTNAKTIVSVGEEYSLYVPSKQGYTFVGWFSENGCKGVQFTDARGKSLQPWDKKQDITLYPGYKAIDYSITYDLNGGSFTTADIVYTYNVESACYFVNPSRLGYTFGGWYTDSNFTTKLTSTIGCYANLHLYAEWIANSYRIAYHLGEGTGYSENPYFYTFGNPPAIVNPTRNGYTFDGWYLDEAFTEKYISTFCYSQNLELYAKWQVATYNISYQLNGGHFGAEVDNQFNVNAMVTLPLPSRIGYTFAGWYTDSNFGNKITNTSNQYQDLIVYAKWTRNQYTIVYDLDGGVNNVSNPYSFEYEEDFTIYEPSKPGYTFAGWYTDSFYTIPYESDSSRANNLHLYAKWEFTNYTITYHLDGGTNHPSNPETYTIADDVVFREAIKTDCLFIGWYLEPTFTTEVTSTKILSGNVSLYARFTTGGKITYVLNGGTNNSLNPTSYEAESQLVLKDATKVGYNFQGWYLEPSYVNRIDETPNDHLGNITLYAKWEAKGYTVTYQQNRSYIIASYDLCGGNEVMEPEIVNTSEYFHYPSIIPTKDNYLFAGWYFDESYSSKFSSNVTKNNDFTLYAKWNSLANGFEPLTDNENTIVLNSTSAPQYYAFTAIYSQNITIEVGKNAYISFSTSSSGSWGSNYRNSYSTSITAGTTYYVRITPYGSSSSYVGETYLNINLSIPTYTVYCGSSGPSSTSETVYFDSDSYNPPEIVNPIATLDGWYDSRTGGTKYIDSDGNAVKQWDKTSSATLYAQWIYEIYNISYELNGGTNAQTNPNSYSYIETVTFANPTKDGYIFDGWYLEEEFVNKVQTTAGLSENITLYAKWTNRSYSVQSSGITSYGFSINSSSNPNSSLYDGCYVSNNYNVSNSYAVAKITFVGYSSFSIYIRSYGESSYDYTIASNLDASSYPTSSSSCKASTSSNQQSGTSISSYTKVTYSGLSSGTHFIYVVYRKDSSNNYGTDRGYFLIDKASY